MRVVRLEDIAVGTDVIDANSRVVRGGGEEIAGRRLGDVSKNALMARIYAVGASVNALGTPRTVGVLPIVAFTDEEE